MREISMRDCAHCGVPFVCVHKLQLYCSVRCRAERQAIRRGRAPGGSTEERTRVRLAEAGGISDLLRAWAERDPK